MAQRLKTIQYGFDYGNTTVANNSLTTITTSTVYIPETTSRTIRKAWVEVTFDDLATTAANLTTKSVRVGIGGNYATVANNNTLTASGENISLYLIRDFTSHFQTYFTAASHSVEIAVQISGQTLGYTNVCATLYVTYEYDDSATTQIKTVYIPLNMATTGVPTSKTSHDTVPNLSTYLPETSKTFRNIHIVTQGNTHSNTTDIVLSMELSTLGASTSGLYENNLATSRWVKKIWDVTSTITTNTTHSFNLWISTGGVVRFYGMQAFMVVTYEFNASTTSSVMNSLILPMEIDTPIGTDASTWQRSDREFWIAEANPSMKRIAAYVFWNNVNVEAGLGARIGTGSFVSYTFATSAVNAGNKSLMIRNDAPSGLSFGRGRNDLMLDMYQTSTTALGGNYGCLWMINYTSDKHSSGVGAHSHSVIWPLHFDTTAGQQIATSTAGAPVIPETNYFLSAVGYNFIYTNNNTLAQGSVSVNMEITSGSEDGLKWLSVYSDAGILDSEVGVNQVWAQQRSLFKRWTGDVGSGRYDIETNRRYMMYLPNQGATQAGAFFDFLGMYFTYHSITNVVSGSIAGSSGGTVDLKLHRSGSYEAVLSTTRSGDGAYSFTWYDDTESVYVVAKESESKRGVSKDALPGTGFDINLTSGGGGGGEFYF